MTKKRKSLKDIINTIVDELERKIKSKYSVGFEKIFSKDGNGVGFYLFPEDLKEKIDFGDDLVKVGNKKNSGCLKFSAKEKGLFEDKKCLDEYEHFRKDLAAIFDRTARTRVPFSVILIQPDFQQETIRQDKKIHQKIIALVEKRIKDSLDPDDIFYPYICSLSKGGDKLLARQAIVMPAAGLNRAKQRINGIKKSIAMVNEAVSLPQTLSVGLEVHHAGDFGSVDALLKVVEQDLVKASEIGDCIHTEGRKKKERSCQVTAEERAQLFSFLQ